jgi:DNA-binding beta-propeller fold protein YncE
MKSTAPPIVATVALVTLAACGDVVYDADSHWDDPRDLPEIGAGKIIVTNSGDDTLSWLDLENLDVVFEEPVGRVAPEREGPHHGAVLPDGSAYFVGLSNFVPGSGSGPHGSHGTGSVPGYLLKYDTATHELVGETQVDRSPGDVRITPDGRYVLQSHFDLLRILEVVEAGGSDEEMVATLAIIDAATMQRVAMVPVCPAPHGVAISQDSSTAYVACWATDELAVVTLDTRTVARYPVGIAPSDPTMPMHEPYAVAISPDDGSVWVSCLRSSDIRIFDPATASWDETRGPVSTIGAPFFIDFNADGTRAYAPVQVSNELLEIDTQTGDILRTLPLNIDGCRAPHAALVLPSEEKALVVCEGDHIDPGSVAIVLLAPFAVEAVRTVGVFPDDAILLLP